MPTPGQVPPSPISCHLCGSASWWRAAGTSQPTWLHEAPLWGPESLEFLRSLGGILICGNKMGTGHHLPRPTAYLWQHFLMSVGIGDGDWITTAPECQKLRLIYNVIKVTGKKLHIKREKAYYTNVQISIQSSYWCFLPSSPMFISPVSSWSFG